jgi:hypothetical protein
MASVPPEADQDADRGAAALRERATGQRSAQREGEADGTQRAHPAGRDHGEDSGNVVKGAIVANGRAIVRTAFPDLRRQ